MRYLKKAEVEAILKKIFEKQQQLKKEKNENTKRFNRTANYC